jgi:hypothetical protein
MAGEGIGQISSTYCQMMKEEVGRNLPKTKLPSCYDRLVRFIAWFDNSIGGARTDRKKARTDHDGVQMSSDFIIGKVIQSKGAWIFKDFKICVRKVDWIGQTLVEYSKPA